VDTRTAPTVVARGRNVVCSPCGGCRRSPSFLTDEHVSHILSGNGIHMDRVWKPTQAVYLHHGPAMRLSSAGLFLRAHSTPRQLVLSTRHASQPIAASTIIRGSLVERSVIDRRQIEDRSTIDRRIFLPKWHLVKTLPLWQLRCRHNDCAMPVKAGCPSSTIAAGSGRRYPAVMDRKTHTHIAIDPATGQPTVRQLNVVADQLNGGPHSLLSMDVEIPDDHAREEGTGEEGDVGPQAA
jgi:hypothetical protein